MRNSVRSQMLVDSDEAYLDLCHWCLLPSASFSSPIRPASSFTDFFSIFKTAWLAYCTESYRANKELRLEIIVKQYFVGCAIHSSSMGYRGGNVSPYLHSLSLRWWCDRQFIDYPSHTGLVQITDPFRSVWNPGFSEGDLTVSLHPGFKLQTVPFPTVLPFTLQNKLLSNYLHTFRSWMHGSSR